MEYGDSGDAAGEFAGATEDLEDADGGRLVHVCPLSGQIGLEAMKQKGNALQYAAPEGRRGTRRAAHPRRATDPSASRPRPGRAEGGVGPLAGPRIFLHAFIPPVRMASPNLPGDSLGVLGGGAVLGLGKREAEAPRRDHDPLGIGGLENAIFAPRNPRVLL